VVYGLILRLAAVAAVSDYDLRAKFSTFVDGMEHLGMTPAEIFVNLLGGVLTSSPIYRTVEKVFKRDPILAGQTSIMMAVKAAQDPVINARMDKILSSADILISSEAVAGALLKEIRERQVQRGGVLEVYQSRNAPIAPIVRLMMPLRQAAG
jgi:hypothetical protein